MLGPCRTKQQVSFAGWTVWDRNSSASKVQITYYREILWIPGRFRLRKRNSFIIKPQYESHVFLTSFLIFLFYFFFLQHPCLKQFNIQIQNALDKAVWVCGYTATTRTGGSCERCPSCPVCMQHARGCYRGVKPRWSALGDLGTDHTRAGPQTEGAATTSHHIPPALEKQEQEGGARRKALELFSNICLQFSAPCLFDQRCLPGWRHQ